VIWWHFFFLGCLIAAMSVPVMSSPPWPHGSVNCVKASYAITVLPVHTDVKSVRVAGIIALRLDALCVSCAKGLVKNVRCTPAKNAYPTPSPFVYLVKKKIYFALPVAKNVKVLYVVLNIAWTVSALPALKVFKSALLARSKSVTTALINVVSAEIMPVNVRARNVRDPHVLRSRIFVKAAGLIITGCVYFVKKRLCMHRLQRKEKSQKRLCLWIFNYN